MVIRELEARYLELSEAESDFLLRRYHRHIHLQPAVGAPGVWLVCATDCCGVIPLPGGRPLHIEPKADIANLWRLLTADCDLMEFNEERVGLQTVAELLWSLAEIFVKRCERLVDAGLLRGYRPREEDLRSVRGRLDVTRTVRRRPGTRHLLACRYDELTADILENRILRWTLHRLARGYFGARDDLRARAARCEARMTGVETVAVTDYDFSQVHFDALNRHYRTPLALAELLLDALGVTHRPGRFDLPPMFLNMPVVFERFAAGLLARALRDTDLRAHSSAHSTALDDHGRLAVTPDVLVTRAGEPVCVIDAKYKLAPDGSGRGIPAAGDVYQMLAYCVGYGVSDAVLVYPERLREEESGSPGRPALTITRQGVTVNIHVTGFNLAGPPEDFDKECERLGRLVRMIGRPVMV